MLFCFKILLYKQCLHLTVYLHYLFSRSSLTTTCLHFQDPLLPTQIFSHTLYQGQQLAGVGDSCPSPVWNPARDCPEPVTAGASQLDSGPTEPAPHPDRARRLRRRSCGERVPERNGGCRDRLGRCCGRGASARRA